MKYIVSLAIALSLTGCGDNSCCDGEFKQVEVNSTTTKLTIPKVTKKTVEEIELFCKCDKRSYLTGQIEKTYWNNGEVQKRVKYLPEIEALLERNDKFEHTYRIYGTDGEFVTIDYI